MKQSFRMLLLLLLAVAAASLYDTAAAKQALEQGVIRLHILADSDRTSDQTEKLLVRDAVMQHLQDWVPADADYDAACDAIRRSLPAIRQTAEHVLRDAGSSDPVAVSFGETPFPARSYGDFTLPAGDYQALRISIGSGSGQNWWCMMYPALCIPAAAEPDPKQDDRALLHGALPESACDIAEQPAKYEVRLKCVDALHAAVRLLREQLAEKPASPEQRSGHP